MSCRDKVSVSEEVKTCCLKGKSKEIVENYGGMDEDDTHKTIMIRMRKDVLERIQGIEPTKKVEDLCVDILETFDW
jgi:hypothetical protein